MVKNMSKTFKSQDYFRYPSMRSKWRRPKGRQSKMRKKKGGSGRVVLIGYGTPNKAMPTLVKSMNDLKSAQGAIILSGTLGLKKAKLIIEEAKKRNIRIVNTAKIKNIKKREKDIIAKKAEGKKKKEKKDEKKDDAKKEAEPTHSHEHINEKHDHANEQHDHAKKDAVKEADSSRKNIEIDREKKEEKKE